MIIASLMLILVAVVLLVLGLSTGSSPLLIGSIGASLLAAVALVVGARHAAAARAGQPGDDDPTDRPRRRASRAERADEPVRRRGTAGSEPTHQEAAWAGAADRGSVALVDPVETVEQTEGGADAPYPPVDPAGVPHRGYDPGAARTVPAEPDLDVDLAEDPPDEPAPQPVTAAQQAAVSRLHTPVLVVDGRPRYHLSGCVHLLGRSSEPLPAGEAVELGFTPCGLCEPDARLLEDAARH